MKTHTQSAAEADNGSQHVVGKDDGFTWEKRANLLNSIVDDQSDKVAQLKYTVEQLNDRLYDTTRKLHDAKTTIYVLHDHIDDLNTKMDIEKPFGWEEFFAMCDDDDTPSTDGGDVGGD